MKKRLLPFILTLLFAHFGNAQYSIPKVPEVQTSFYDYIGLINQSGARFLKEKLLKYSDSTATQIVMIIIKSTDGEKTLDLATRWGNEWGIGHKDKDNGIVLLVAKDDREVAIATGDGIQEELTDYEVKKIIDDRIVPEFKKGKYYRGLRAGADGIFEAIKGTKPKKESFGKIANYDESFMDIVYRNLYEISVTVLIIIGIIFGRKFPTRNRRNDRYDDRWDDNDSDYWGKDRRSRTFGGFDVNSDSSSFDDGYEGGSFNGGGASGSW